jgi:hypothetical protein
MPLAFHSHPRGMDENSPMLQRWRPSIGGALVPKGRLNTRTMPGVPSRLRHLRTWSPNAEALGYCRMSLRDKDSARSCNRIRRSNPNGVGHLACCSRPSPNFARIDRAGLFCGANSSDFFRKWLGPPCPSSVGRPTLLPAERVRRMTFRQYVSEAAHSAKRR